jgi:hypothetical protein
MFETQRLYNLCAESSDRRNESLLMAVKMGALTKGAMMKSMPDENEKTTEYRTGLFRAG